MENKIFDNLKNKNISESSLKLYLNNLKRLNAGQEIKNFNFLKDTEKIVNHIKDYKPNTRRSYLISIVSLLKQEPKFKKLYDIYYKMLMEYNKDLQINNVKSETQKDNWITQKDVLEIYKQAEDKLLPKLVNKKKINEDEYKELLSFVILSLYTLQAPRRNLDYLYMMMVKKYNDDMDKKYNYLDLGDNEFNFNNYKTNKTYKTQTIPVSPDLQNVIKLFIKFHPLKSEIKKKNIMIPLIVNYQGVQPISPNFITRILNKIFDRKIGASMLRNIYLTSKYSDNQNNLNADASNMGTSSNVIQNQYIKLDNPITN